MPALDTEEIRTQIADGRITAISVDTSIFDRYGCNLDYQVFRSLRQFAGGAVTVLISEIVAREVMAHIASEAAEAQRKLRKALSVQRKRWKIDTAEPAAYRLAEDATDAATDQFEEFAQTVRATVVPALGPNDRTAEILDLYFATGMPFEKSDAKKNEFPDAFALLSLEAHARRGQTMILCVSTDHGWAKYCETSDVLVCVKELVPALALFNVEETVVTERTMAFLRDGRDEDLVRAVTDAIETRLDEVDFHPTGWSSVEFETEPVSSVLESVLWESATDATVIAADQESVAFTTTLTARVSFQASFRFEVFDGIDRDYVSLGSEQASKDVDIEFELAVTVPRDPDEGLEIVEIGVARRQITVNFGTVEPFQSEDPTHEKY